MRVIIIFLAGVLSVNGVLAQGFGRNKPRYNEMDFKVLETPHFEIHHYLENQRVLNDFADWSEQWYLMHQTILQDTFTEKNPIILYNNHADFQQTTAISGMIGIGTGGVTEGLRNRVVLPIAMSNQQTHHVLGHELVHAFQYHKLLHNQDTTLSLKSLQNVPLWMVEGMAEYLSLGRIDAHTAMWMRDAVLQDDIPSIKDLSKATYFPYRYGQAFWAFVAGAYGDSIIEPLFIATAKYGLERALDSVLNMGQKNVTFAWKSALQTWYKPLLENQKEALYGKKILSEENAGEMNINPVLSPNGKYVIFLSEKDLFTTDLYLANAISGKIIRKVASTLKDEHLDNLDFIESAGTWSPDSKLFAFVAYRKGKHILVIKNVSNGKTMDELAIPGLQAFSNPSWSPDGKMIVVSGLVEGQTDLYGFRWKTGEVVQLTDDQFAELHPSWSKDGTQLAFASDKLSMIRGRSHGEWTFQLAVMDMQSGEIAYLDFFPEANTLNPVFDHEGKLWFLSNRDGFRNLYVYDPSNGKIIQKTRLLTGISGITQYAPAISIGGKYDRVVFSYYSNRKYAIYSSKPEKFLQEEVNPDSVDFKAATLPPLIAGKTDWVNAQLARIDQMADLRDSSKSSKAYRPRFELEYAGGSTGVGVGQQTFGTTTAMQGGVDLLFGDMLGHRKLYTGLALNGEIYDAAGQLTFLNQKHRFGWGVSLSHIPYRSALMSFEGIDTLQISETTGLISGKYLLDVFRMFEERASMFGQYPFSTTTRLEGGIAFSSVHYRLDEFTNWYDSFGQLVLQDREKQDVPPGFRYFSVNSAFVHDNSFFGVAAPLQGRRYRAGIEQYFGELTFISAIADYRQYLYARPVTFAFRIMHLGRYGQEAEALTPLYLGSPWFVRGYGFSQRDILEANQLSTNQLAGSKILVGNLEVRLPFTGPKRLALISSKVLLTDLNWFLDGGMAWSQFSDFGSGGSSIGIFQLAAKPLFSTGFSLRVNVFGAAVLEPYLAMPLLRETRTVFGVNVVPGW